MNAPLDFAPSPSRTEPGRIVADRLVAATAATSAEFPHVLANHLPMVLEIMTRLGAAPERLQEYATRYNAENRVPPLPSPADVVPPHAWERHLGDRGMEAALRAFFAAEVRRDGGRNAIRRSVPRLAAGIGASALHALMRLAYGIMRRDDGEIGIALGYWAATFLPLPQPVAAPGDLTDPLAVLLLMREVPAFATIQAESDLLWHWIRAVGQRSETAALAGRLAVDEGTLDRIAEASLTLYASTMSFEALHALTGAHWLRQVLPLVDDPAPLLRNFWHVVMAVYPKIGMPLPLPRETLDGWRTLDLPDPDDVMARAVASDDEHDPSLVYSAHEEYARTLDPLYRVVAARRVGLLP